MTDLTLCIPKTIPALVAIVGGALALLYTAARILPHLHAKLKARSMRARDGRKDGYLQKLALRQAQYQQDRFRGDGGR